MSRENQRVTVVELHKQEMKRADIVRTTGYKKQTVYDAVKRYEETGGTADRPRSGRPTTTTTPENVNKVRCRIRRNPEISMNKMAKELEISHERVRHIVKKKLGLRSYKIARVHFLNEAMKAKRLQRCHRMHRLVACRRCSSPTRRFSRSSRPTTARIAVNCSRRGNRKPRRRKPSAAVTFRPRSWSGPGSAPPGRRLWSSSSGTSRSTPPAISNESSATLWNRGQRSTSAQPDSRFRKTEHRRIPPNQQLPSAKSSFLAFGARTFGRRTRRISTRSTTRCGPSWSKKSRLNDTPP